MITEAWFIEYISYQWQQLEIKVKAGEYTIVEADQVYMWLLDRSCGYTFQCGD